MAVLLRILVFQDVTLPDLASGPQRLAQQSTPIFRAAMTLKDEGIFFLNICNHSASDTV